ncbi:hypothetical protein VNO78_31267 [Psophocarpus tetragonolobus]|uniref:Uncharacterized protein n=1 Tax=Psophocarpus tetragonolobus TaxID=3891 RepID=A0AAN9X978_PSOTE
MGTDEERCTKTNEDVQSEVLDDLIPPRFVWHVLDANEPLERELRNFYGKAPSIVKMCIQILNKLDVGIPSTFKEADMPPNGSFIPIPKPNLPYPLTLCVPTFDPKRWELPQETNMVSASTANELREDRYVTHVSPEKLKAATEGLSHGTFLQLHASGNKYSFCAVGTEVNHMGVIAIKSMQ